MLNNIIDRELKNKYATGLEKQEAFLHSTVHQRMADKVRI